MSILTHPADAEQLADADRRRKNPALADTAAHTPATPPADNHQRVADTLSRVRDHILTHGTTPDQAEAMREITRIVMESGDPSGAARQVLDLVQKCSTHGWCVETGDHYDHASDPVTVRTTKDDEPPYLDAHILHLSGSRPIIGFGGADLTADQARAEVAKMREFADKVEAMADVLAAAESAPTPITIEETQLDPGVPMMWRRFTSGRARLAWDPQQTDRAAVEALLLTEFGPYVEVTAEAGR